MGADRACAAAGFVLIHVLRVGPQLTLTRSPWFILLVACSMLERLSAFASDVALERDWITQVRAHQHWPMRPVIFTAWSFAVVGMRGAIHAHIVTDCCLQLSGKANQGALSHSNAVLRRLDLLSEMGGTLALGCCMSWFGAPRTLAALSALVAAALPAMLALVDKV